MTELHWPRRDFEGRVSLITGGTRGLGRAMAETLLLRGARVVVTGRDPDVAETVAGELDPKGEHSLGLSLDITSRESFASVIAAVRERWNTIDILVNNAGTTVSRSIWDIDDQEWDRVLVTNLRSVLIGCQLIGPLMRDNGYGRIINHASLAGQEGGAVAGAHYAASKAGIIVLTKILAKELAGDGVTVNAIAPAAVWSTPMSELPDEQVSELAGSIPVGRIGQPEDVAALVAFLASEKAGYITGATYDINGGLSMR